MTNGILDPETMKALPVGYDNFREVIENDLYYVDKTLMIRDLLIKKAKVNLFTRPRRFGKTLNMSMLEYFFENGWDIAGKKMEYRHLFERLKIAKCGEKYMQHQGKYLQQGCLARSVPPHQPADIAIRQLISFASITV